MREAIGGTQQDFTEGSLGRAIALLAIPMVLEMIMESLFGVVNVFFVAGLGSDAVSAVGMTESILTILFTIAIGLSMATTATVARRIGEKDVAGARQSAVQAIGAGVPVSIVLGVLGAKFAPWLLGKLGAWPSLLQVGTAYTTLLLGGSGTIVLLFLMNAVFRGAGDAAIAMRVLWLANLVNIFLVPCLVVGWGPFPKMGLTGAALGTTIGRGVGVLYQFWSLFRGGGRVVLRRKDIRLQVKPMVNLMRISLPAMFQYAIATASWLGLVRIISTYGSAALAGYTIGIRVLVFALLPSWGMSNAAATLVGQNLGAGKPWRAEQAVWRTGFYNMLFLGTAAVAFIVFARPVIGLFTSDPEVIAVGVDCLRLISYGYPFFAFGMVVVQAFNGAGDTATPTMVNLFCYWLWEIPLAYALAKLAGMGPRGVFLAIAIAESTTACVGVAMFRRGRWKRRRV
ncbi:MAG TPA: MATE family efflux transporter [Rhizomicrobium sp.]|nr:MATE family efflux transporter [Rhizomicrobium sp.]